MAKRTHYEVLGVQRSFTTSELRTAYRRMALQHHPDRSKAPDAVRQFIEVVQAYEVLKDSLRRASYDRLLALELGHAAVHSDRHERVATPAGGRRAERTQARVAVPPPDYEHLTKLYSRGRFVEAEQMARQMIRSHPKAPVPYAVLGDVLRARSDFDGAARMYAYAYQCEPSNAFYAQRHEELMGILSRNQGRGSTQQFSAVPLMVGLIGVVLLAVYLVLAREPALVPNLPLVSSWTLGAVMTLFLSGLVAGGAMSRGNLLDRFQAATSGTAGRPSPTVALGFVAVVNFWAAALMYVTIGQTQNAYHYSTSRLVGASAACTVLLSLAAALGGTVDPLQMAIWGGNLAYMGSLCGWMVADSLQR